MEAARTEYPPAVLFAEESRLIVSLLENRTQLHSHALNITGLLEGDGKPVPSLGIRTTCLKEILQKLNRFLDPVRIQVSFADLTEDIAKPIAGIQAVRLLVLFKGFCPVSNTLEGPAQVVMVIGIGRVDSHCRFEVGARQSEVATL